MNQKRAKTSTRKKVAKKKAVPAVSNLVRRWKTARAQVDQMENQLQKFEMQDVPQFNAWLDKNFGDELKEIAELDRKCQILKSKISKVNLLVMFGKYQNPCEAVRDMSFADIDEEFGKLDPNEFDSDVTDHETDQDGIPNESLRDCIADDPVANMELEDMLEGFLVAMTNMSRDEVGEEKFQEIKRLFLEAEEMQEADDFRHFAKALQQLQIDPTAENISAVKKEYRALAKILHPDQNPDVGELEKQLWTETQEAYEIRDLMGLLEVRLRIRIERRTPLESEDISVLHSSIERLSELRNELKEEVKMQKATLPWEFSLRSEESMRCLFEQHSEEIDEELAFLRGHYQSLCKDWERLAAAPKLPASTSRHAKQMPIALPIELPKKLQTRSRASTSAFRPKDSNPNQMEFSF